MNTKIQRRNNKTLRLDELHHFFIHEGMREDMRGPKQLKIFLAEQRKNFRKTTKALKKFFDREDLVNPYADTRVLCGDPQAEIKTILVGIDIGIGELLWANELARQGKKIDLVLAHHPEGLGLAGLAQVMALQIDWLVRLGLDKKVAKELMEKRMEEVGRSVHADNHQRVVDVARQLGLALACCHTPADNHVAAYLQKIMDTKKPKTLTHIVDLLCQEPEYQMAAAMKSGPRVVVGKPKDKAGKVVIDMTGGTEGSRDVFARLSQAGVATVIGMHMSEGHIKQVKNEYINVVIAGHIASDNIGLNLLLDKLQRRVKGVEILECSGFRRVRR